MTDAGPDAVKKSNDPDRFIGVGAEIGVIGVWTATGVIGAATGFWTEGEGAPVAPVAAGAANIEKKSSGLEGAVDEDTATGAGWEKLVASAKKSKEAAGVEATGLEVERSCDLVSPPLFVRDTAG